jgi:adenosylcobalamin-dependent ribonucleoside-triphosphate reductase
MNNIINDTPNFGPIGEDVYRRTYSRIMDDGRREDWSDTCRRVIDGNMMLDPLASDAERHEMMSLMMRFAFLPAGRHLWVTGVPNIPGEARRNCFRAPFTKRLGDHFEFLGSMLLLGGGVGANYSHEYLSQAGAVFPFNLSITCRPDHKDYEAVRSAAGEFFTEVGGGALVDDSREGWVAAWGSLFDAATCPLSAAVTLDVSMVRPHGDPIRTFGGTASGPAPLVSAIVGIYRVLAGAVGRSLTGIEAMHCDHAIASAVVAGGARRSARMSIMHWRDPSIFEFVHCKEDHMHHWTTNISVEVDNEFFVALDAGDDHARNVLDQVIVGMHRNGEPGFYNSSLSSLGERGDVRSTNPCGEVPLEMGESCNIGSVDIGMFGTDTAAAERAFRLMTRFLIRQTMANIRTEPTASVEARNRRIGVGFLGMQEWAAAHGVRYSDIAASDALRSKMRLFRMACRDEANRYCDELGIPRCIKVTAIAPNGTIAQLRGTQAGAHAILARWYIRNVRYTVGDPRIDKARNEGLKVEPCIYAENTMVVSYPVADPLIERFGAEIVQQIDEVSIADQFAVLAAVTGEFTGGGDGNAVSFTASFDPEMVEIDDLKTAVRRWLPHVKGMTVFPTMSRPQSPYIPISEQDYLSMTSGLGTVSGDTGDEDIACSIGGACPVR